MNISLPDLCLLCACATACLTLGSLHLRFNLWLFAIQTTSIAMSTVFIGYSTGDSELFVIAALIFIIKAICVPQFLSWIADKLNAQREKKTLLPAPISMHICFCLFALSFLLAKGIPQSHVSSNSALGAAAGISLLLSGLMLMLTRSTAIAQVLGFLVIENGIFTFALTQTRGMPLMIEMGILLDVLVAVMISGLLIFKIQKSFEHIDITQLRDLRD